MTVLFLVNAADLLRLTEPGETGPVQIMAIPYDERAEEWAGNGWVVCGAIDAPEPTEKPS